MLSAIKVEYSLFMELDESTTLLWLFLCVAKEFISILWRTFTELINFSMIHLFFL